MIKVLKGIVFSIRLVAPVLILFVFIAAVVALQSNKPEPEKNDDTRQVAALTVAQAESKSVQISVETRGEVRAKTDINIVPEVAGRIVFVADNFAEGGVFEKGTVLARIDDTQYKLAVIRAEARVAEAVLNRERQLADARIKEKQWREFDPKGDPDPLAVNKPQVAEANARLRSAEADLDEAKLNLSRTAIKLPFSGRVSRRDVGLGQFVSIGATLGRAFATDVVEIRLPLTDLQIGELNLDLSNDAGEGSLDVPVSLSASLGGRKQNWDARLVRVQASVDQQTRLFYGIAEVKKPYDPAPGALPLPVGLFVSATIQSNSALPAIIIPRTALRGENTVYTVTDDKMYISEVAVFSTSSDEVVLLSGIAPGTQVVTSSVRRPTPGMTVRVVGADVADSDGAESDDLEDDKVSQAAATDASTPTGTR